MSQHFASVSGRCVRNAWTVTRRCAPQSVFLMVTVAIASATVVLVVAAVQSVLLKPLPYDAPDELVRISVSDRLRGLLDRDLSPPDYLDIAEQTSRFAGFGGAEVAPAALAVEGGRAVRIDAARVTASWFDLLGASPEAGRFFGPGEQGPAAPSVAVLASTLAVERFGNPASAIGRSIGLDGESFLVIGVAARRPPLAGMDVDVWVPLPYDASARRQAGVISVVARLRAGTEVREAASELAAVSASLEAAYPDSNEGRRFDIQSLSSALTADARPFLAGLAGAVGLLLIATVISTSVHLIGRLLQRGPEMGIRRALGATRNTLAAQLAVEGAFIGLTSGVTGAGVAAVALAIFGRTSAGVALTYEPVSLGVLPVMAGMTVAVAVVLAATALAVRFTRSAATLEMRRAQPGGVRVRRLLLAAQLAAATALVIGVGMLGGSLARLAALDLGFEPRQLVTLAVDIPDSRYAIEDDAGRAGQPRTDVQQLYDSLLARVSSVAGVQRAALGMQHPLERGFLTAFAPAGGEATPPGERDRVNLRAVSPGYFEVIGARLLAGRSFGADDAAGAEPVVVVNRTLERTYFDDGAIGERVLFYGTWWRVVGVVADVRSHGLERPPRPAVFASLRQLPAATVQVVVRGDAPVGTLLTGARDAIWEVDRELAPHSLAPLESLLSSAGRDRRLMLGLFSAFGVMALGLACVGLAGSVVEGIEARRRELAVRLALGADQVQLLTEATRGTLAAMAAGVALGLFATPRMIRLLDAWLFEVETAAIGTTVLVGAVLLAVGAAATLVPALRVLRLSPGAVLRSGAE